MKVSYFRSKAWRYFTKKTGGFAYCQKCFRQIKYSNNITNLVKHLMQHNIKIIRRGSEEYIESGMPNTSGHAGHFYGNRANATSSKNQSMFQRSQDYEEKKDIGLYSVQQNEKSVAGPSKAKGAKGQYLPYQNISMRNVSKSPVRYFSSGTADIVPLEVNDTEAIQDIKEEIMDLPENQTEEPTTQSEELFDISGKGAILSDIYKYVNELEAEKKESLDVESRKEQLELNILMSRKKRESDLQQISSVHLEQAKVKLTQEEMKLKQEVLKVKMLEVQLAALQKS